MAFSTPDLTPGFYAAAVGIVCQLTGLPDSAKENITTIAIAITAGDTAVRLGRQKWVSQLMADRDKSGVPDFLERTPLAWWIAFAAIGVAVALAVALLLILFL